MQSHTDLPGEMFVGGIERFRVDDDVEVTRRTGLAEQFDGVDAQRAQRIGHVRGTPDQWSWSKKPLVGSSSSTACIEVSSTAVPIDRR